MKVQDWIVDPATARPMRVFAEGLRWLDRYREGSAGKDLLSDEDLVALAYAQGHFAGHEAITGRFVGCPDLSSNEIWRRFDEAYAWSGEPVDRPAVRNVAAEGRLLRDQRQVLLVDWARAAFGEAETASVPQRGLRLLEEAIEAFQACGGDEAMAHKLVMFVFGLPPGTVGQELGGVAVTTLLLAEAAGLSADEEECREMQRVLGKPVGEFTARNANKNAAGFLVEAVRKNPCCGNVGTHGEGGREYCSTCGQEQA